MVREKSPIERPWRNATLLFFGIFVVCAIIASLLTGVVPSNMEWAGIDIPIAIATLGTIAAVAGGLCFIRLITLRVQSGDDDR